MEQTTVEPVYAVIVSNIGQVHTGREEQPAREAYDAYVIDALRLCGRAAGESVTLTRNDEPIAEHEGYLFRSYEMENTQ